jgi:hypothetical protein|tara:strand:+ start:51 stop:455 length:405 start_codon:yes stop_codon:yes gene_type:complete
MADKELERLKREIAEEKREIRKVQVRSKAGDEKRKLQRELFLLKNPTIKTAIGVGQRFKRGGKILAKKAGVAFVKQAKLIKAQQEREARAADSLAKRKKIITPGKTKFKKRKIKKRSLSKSPLDDFNPMANLDF